MSELTNFTELAPISSIAPGLLADQLRLAVAAYLARFKGSSRDHTESGLRCYLAWCTEHGLDPLAVRAPAPGAVHPPDARDPAVQALNDLKTLVGHGRVLPHLRH